MVSTLILATSNGVITCDRSGGEWQVANQGLQNMLATSVIAREGVILVGTTNGVFRSEDLGRTWREASAGLDQRHVRWMAFHPDISDREFAGTEPAGIYRSKDGGESWQACPEVAGLRDRFRWYLPYSPKAGCVRGFAFHGKRTYAAVEVGGVLVSDDGGETWGLVEGSPGEPHRVQAPHVHPDVHSITVHPSSPDLVFAPTGGGFYRSSDGGQSWEMLYDCYCRAAWADPLDPDHILLGPADSVDFNGRIEETNDGGRTWHAASENLNVPWRHHMVERFYQAGDMSGERSERDELLAVLSNGELLATSIQELAWKPILSEIKAINAVTLMI